MIDTEIDTEAQKLNQYQEAEQAWLTAYVSDGIFNQDYLGLLRITHDQMRDKPLDYLLGVNRFLAQVLDKGLDNGQIGPNARLLAPKIFVGLNIVFGPTDPSHQGVSSELYPRTLQRFGIQQDHVMPFTVLMADAYYFQGSAYNQGVIEGDVIDSGYEVFKDWEQTWAYLHTSHGIFSS